MKKSKSDLVTPHCFPPSKEGFSLKKLFYIRVSLMERIRSIWKLSSKRTPIVFRKIYAPARRTSIPIRTKTSFGFSTDEPLALPTPSHGHVLVEQSSVESFHTARESLSTISFLDTEHTRTLNETSQKRISRMSIEAMGNAERTYSDRLMDQTKVCLPRLTPPSSIQLWPRTRRDDDTVLPHVCSRLSLVLLPHFDGEQQA